MNEGKNPFLGNDLIKLTGTDIEFHEPSEKIDDRCDKITGEGEKIDPSEYKKYIAFYDLVVYGKDDDTYVNLNDANCIFLAINMDMAKYIAVHQVVEMSMLEDVAIRSLTLKRIKCVDTGEEFA